MNSLLTQIKINNIKRQKLETESRNLTYEVIKTHGKVMGEKPFWELIEKLKKQIERSIQQNNSVKSGIHNFFYYNYQGNEQEIIDFIHTYKLKVERISNDETIYETASKFEYFSDDGWYDFTDYLPMQGEEAYNHVLNDRREHPVYHDRHEEYIHSSLIDKLMLFASPLEEEDEEKLYEEMGV